MQSYRQGIQRHLSKHSDKEIDITKKETFKKSTTAFQCMGKELKRQGFASIDHYPAIEDEDWTKMYSFFASNLDDAQLLQYKVGFLFSEIFFY